MKIFLGPNFLISSVLSPESLFLNIWKILASIPTILNGSGFYKYKKPFLGGM